MSNKPSMRDQMPQCAAFIDALRSAFGADAIDSQIKRGMKGEFTFWASENGHEIGSRSVVSKKRVGYDDRGISFSYDVPAGLTFQQEQEIRKQAHLDANARMPFNRQQGVDQ